MHTNLTSVLPDCFIHFKASIDDFALPTEFNYPFNYEPHPLCRLAAKELQLHIVSQSDWKHEFGLEQRVEGTNIGKMFGVLLVRAASGKIGYLAAFSGKLAGKNLHRGFVPPIVDLLQEDGFYRIGEDEITKINHRIREIEESAEYRDLLRDYADLLQTSEQEIAKHKEASRLAKIERDALRKQLADTTDAQTAAKIEQLNNESIKWQYDHKHLVRDWKARLADIALLVEQYSSSIQAMKEERKQKSAALQQQMFERYQFLNGKGEYKSVCEIFEHTEAKIPPAGAGDCAAPKLLQYAYQNNLEPLSMAEFWWGQSPRSEIRQHAFFYPACRGKCEPILWHMLDGLRVAANPSLRHADGEQQPEIMYEDEAIALVNKPAEYLSVPGKTALPSVYDFARLRYPNATGPLIVHRLDMSTSGILILAKTMDAYLFLQKQFMNHSILKRYVAVLDGEVTADEGIIDLPLRVDLDNRPRQLVCYEYGKQAITRWRVIERVGGKTRVYFYPQTGRTHQLRVHAAHRLGLNCAIVGDDLYGQKADRLHLHAEYIEFVHPTSKERVHFILKPEF